MKKDHTKTLMILLVMGIGGYIVYRYIFGNKIPWIDLGGGGSSGGGGGSQPGQPTQPAPQIPVPTPAPTPTQKTPLPNTWYEDKSGYRSGTVPVVSPKPGQYQGGPFVTTPEVPPYFAPVTNSHIPQLVIIGKAPEKPIVTGSNLTVTTTELKQFASINPLLKTQAPVNFVSAEKPIIAPIQPAPLKAFGVNITAQPSITLPAKIITQKTPVISGTTKLSTVLSIPTIAPAPVPRLTTVLKGLIAR